MVIVTAHAPVVPLVNLPAVAPPTVVELEHPEAVNLVPLAAKAEAASIPPAVPSPSWAVIVVPEIPNAGPLEVINPNCRRVNAVPALFVKRIIPSAVLNICVELSQCSEAAAPVITPPLNSASPVLEILNCVPVPLICPDIKSAVDPEAALKPKYVPAVDHELG